MDKNKPHLNWNLFLEASQLPLDPVVGSPIKARPSMRIDPKDPDPDTERDLDPEELALMLQKANSENPATGMEKDDRDFKSPTSDVMISFASDAKNTFKSDKEDKKAKSRIKSFWDVAQYTDTIDLKKLEEMILEELRKVLDEANIRRKK